MIENEFLRLKLMRGQLILIYLISGHVVCGAYMGGFENGKLEFDFENHKTNQIDKVRLTNIDRLIT